MSCLFCTVNDKCTAGQCTGAARACGDGVQCTVDSCDEQADACRAQPSDERCDDDEACTVDTCVAGVGCTNEFACKDICRRSNFYAKRAGGDGNVVQEILDAVGGIEVCGQTVSQTSIEDSVGGLGLDSALEGLCVKLDGSEDRELYRELVTTALNCAMSGSDDCDDVTDEFLDVSYDACNAYCAGGSEELSEESEESFARTCIRSLDCYNNGGRMIGGRCAYGTCDVTGEYCGSSRDGGYGPCQPVGVLPVQVLQVCERFPDNCRDEDFCQEVLEVCPERVPASGGRACRDAARNDCTIDFCDVD